MYALDGTVHRLGVMELCPHRPILPFHPSIRRSNRSYCFAKVTVNDDEEKHETSRKGFPIRVPTIPNLRDVESARRMLESAFQALSFEMPRIAIDSAALQGLTFDIFKLSIPKRMLIFDITGFVATRLKKKPAKTVDEGVYPRCPWPRNPKEARAAEGGVNLVLEESMAASTPGMRTALELHDRPFTASSANDVAILRGTVGPHCAWPRKSQALSAAGVGTDLLHPRSAWPRRSLPANGAAVSGELSVAELSTQSDSRKEEVSSCIIEGGARCAWPRKTVSAKHSCGADEGLQKNKDADECKTAASDSDDGAAELPRRMLATSVGLTVMNQLVKGSMVTSLLDFCSSLPGGSLEIADEGDVSLGLGRRTLLVFIKQSAN